MQKKQSGSPFMTTKEAAKFLRVQWRTMDNWRWAGRGPKYRKHGNRILYHRDDLIRFSETGRASHV